MNILLIPDKFKGSLSAREVILALKRGIEKFDPSIDIFEAIASDGGDGFLEAITVNDNIQYVEVTSVDPLGRKMMSRYGFNDLDRTAYIELANTSGLSLLSELEKNVLKTSTYGTGLQIEHALSNGAKKVFVGLGGSATNDGGIGIAKALGYKFLDIEGNDLEPIGSNLDIISKILAPLENRFKSVEFYAVNDVKNPLFGNEGAAKVYGKQKGGDEKTIDFLDKGLRNLHKLVMSQLKANAAEVPGAGAAGGAAYGLKVFLNAGFINGIEFILTKNKILDYFYDDKIDLIITGEGKIDDQTAYGKLVRGVADIGEKFQVPVIAICGKKELIKSNKENLGLIKIIEIGDKSQSLEYKMKNALQLIQKAIINYFKNNS